MNIPPFSIFSAVSEIVVTVVVLYSIIHHYRGGRLPWKLLGVALLFEFSVNVVYMVHRAAVVDSETQLSSGLRNLFILHGILSMVMFLALVLAYLYCTFEQKAGLRTWLQRHPVGTWTFIVLWIISVGSGEAAFVWRYLV